MQTPPNITRKILPPPAPLPRGRGALSNRTGRFEPLVREPIDDGWGDDGRQDSLERDEAPRLVTRVTIERPRTIIARNSSPDIPFDRSINPYRGCEHGCVYCYARPTHAFMNLSPGLDFESNLFAKPDAPALLKKELSKRGYKPDVIAMGTNTDPYQPIEREHKITRRVLEVLAAADHPVSIVTKSALVTRDLDILAPMAEKNLVRVALSVTSLDRRLARAMEPRAATPPKRLETIRKLSEAGIPTGVMMAPLIPALNDAEIESVLAAAAEAGARQAGYVMLRLPLEIGPLFREWLAALLPDRAAHVMKLVKDMHNGKDYEAQWRIRQTGRGPYAQMIGKRFRLAMKHLGLTAPGAPLDTSLFKPPDRKQPRRNPSDCEQNDQLSLF